MTSLSGNSESVTLAGWSAAKLKEAVCRSTISSLRREARKPGSAFWFKGGKRPAAATVPAS